MADTPLTAATTPAEQPLWERTDILVVSGLVVAALALRLWLIPNFDVISSDGTGYALTAQKLLHGDVSLLYRYGFYPVLIAIVHLFTPNLELAGRLASAIMGSLLIVPVYGLSKALCNRNVAISSALLIVAWPEMVTLSCDVLTQTTYIFLIYSGIYLTWCSFDSGSTGGVLLSGTVLGLAYMTRTEALILPVALMAAPLLRLQHDRANLLRFTQLFGVYGFGFLLVLVPNILLIHHATGAWQLAAKTSGALRDGIIYYLNKPHHELPPELESIGYWQVIKSYPGYFAYTLKKNLLDTWRMMLPLPFWLLAALGFLASGWDRQSIQKRLYLLSTLAPYLVIVFFFYVGTGYYLPYLPILFIWAGEGLLTFDRLIPWRRLSSRLHPRLASIPLSLIIVITFVTYTYCLQIPRPAPVQYRPGEVDGRIIQKELGLMIKKILPPGKLMTRWVRTGFYAERDSVGIPERGTIDDVLAEARSNNVRFLLIEPMTVNNRPQIAILNEPAQAAVGNDLPSEPQVKYFAQYQVQPHPGFLLYMLYRDQRGVAAAIYEILPEGT